jgi:enoyl-CoA hydratase/carnithine racemase
MTTHIPYTWQTRDQTGILELNNPPGNFLVEPEFIPVDILDGFLHAEEIKGLVITGTGKHFSGGASLDDLFLQASETELETEMNMGKELLEYIDRLKIPVVAAIKGLCFGGGLEIALACDIRVCSANALFAFPESNHNMMPGLSGTVRLPERVRFAESVKMILGGDMINAEEALEMKLVDKVVYDEDPLDHSLRFLKKITEGKSLKVIGFIMTALRNSKSMPVNDALLEETRMFCELAREEAERRKSSEQ